MIYHASFGVSQPDRVAAVLAEITRARALRAPSPPFPQDAWLLVSGDAQGSFLEILPATAVFDQKTPFGLRQRPAKIDPVASHVLVNTPLKIEDLRRIAQREDWPLQEVETGLFKIVKLWIEQQVLIEFLTDEETDRYVATFGSKGLPTLDEKLRQLETQLGAALAQKFSPQQLAESFGDPSP